MLDILDIVRLHVGMKSSAESDHLTIGQVAEHFGLATHVLRHWEAAGLLTPPRAASGQRRYQPVDLYRVAAILRGKEAGLALDDIRAMTTGAGPATRATILRQQRDDLAVLSGHVGDSPARPSDDLETGEGLRVRCGSPRNTPKPEEALW